MTEIKPKTSTGAWVSKGGKPTLRTISEISGLAVPTVSRALSDAPDIGKDTKKLVRKIAADIGYVPNRAGVRLRTGRTNVVSLVMPTEQEMMNTTARLIYSIAAGLKNTAYHLIVTPYAPEDDPLVPIKYIVETGSADAVIFNQTLFDDPRVDYLLDRGFPFATHGRTRRMDEHAWFDFDNTAYASIAMTELARRGRNRVLLVHPPEDQNYSIDMQAGAKAAASDLNCELVMVKGFTSDDTNETIRQGLLQTFRNHGVFDAIITAGSNAALAAIAAVEDLGLVIGDDIDIFAKETIPFLKLVRKEVLLIEEDVFDTGTFLAGAAIHAIRNRGEPPMQSLDVPTRP